MIYLHSNMFLNTFTETSIETSFVGNLGGKNGTKLLNYLLSRQLLEFSW